MTDYVSESGHQEWEDSRSLTKPIVWNKYEFYITKICQPKSITIRLHLVLFLSSCFLPLPFKHDPQLVPISIPSSTFVEQFSNGLPNPNYDNKSKQIMVNSPYSIFCLLVVISSVNVLKNYNISNLTSKIFMLNFLPRHH